MKKKFEDLMSAISFAEEEDFETARQFLKEGKRVLLALRGGQIDGKTLRYALNACKRIEAGLDILYISSEEKAEPALEKYLSDLKDAGIPWRLVRKEGCLKQQIIDYSSAHREILFAVTESTIHLEAECKGKGKGLSEAWRNLKCPLVVVAEGA